MTRSFGFLNASHSSYFCHSPDNDQAFLEIFRDMFSTLQIGLSQDLLSTDGEAGD